jgi:hypothetical protein
MPKVNLDRSVSTLRVTARNPKGFRANRVDRAISPFYELWLEIDEICSWDADLTVRSV